jgi:hypothetical protein
VLIAPCLPVDRRAGQEFACPLSFTQQQEDQEFTKIPRPQAFDACCDETVMKVSGRRDLRPTAKDLAHFWCAA